MLDSGIKVALIELIFPTSISHIKSNSPRISLHSCSDIRDVTSSKFSNTTLRTLTLSLQVLTSSAWNSKNAPEIRHFNEMSPTYEWDKKILEHRFSKLRERNKFAKNNETISKWIKYLRNLMLKQDEETPCTTGSWRPVQRNGGDLLRCLWDSTRHQDHCPSLLSERTKT